MAPGGQEPSLEAAKVSTQLEAWKDLWRTVVIRVRVTVPSLVVAAVMAVVLLTGCAVGSTPIKPTCCDQAVRGPNTVEVSGVLLVTGGVTNGPTLTPVSGGMVTFRLAIGPGYSSVSVRTGHDGEFHVYLAPGAYRVEAANATSPGALKGTFGPFQIHSRHNRPLKLTLVAL